MVARSQETHDGQHPRQRTSKTKSIQDHAPTHTRATRGLQEPRHLLVRPSATPWGPGEVTRASVPGRAPNQRLHLTPGSGGRWRGTMSVAPAQVKRGVRPLRAKREKTKIYNREPQHDSANSSAEGAITMNKQLTMVYWKGERFWLGKLLEHPDIMTQGETVEELEDNLKDAYRLLVMDDVPDDHHTKAITL